MIHPTHEMLTAGARAIGRTIKWPNHYDRAKEVFRVMMENYVDSEKLPEIPDTSKLTEGQK